MNKSITSKTNERFFRISIFSITLIAIAFMAIKEKTVLLLLAICCILQFILNKKLLLDVESILLLAGMTFYGILGKFPIFLIMKLIFIPFLFYSLGKSLLILQEQKKSEYRAHILVIVLCLGLLFGSILNAITRSFLGVNNGRYWGEFWTRQSMPATQLAFYDLLIIGLMFYGIYNVSKKRWLNGILIVGGLWSLWFSLITYSRMQIVIFVIVFGINLILFCYLNKNNIAVRKYAGIFLVALLILCILVAVFYVFNIKNLADYVQSSMWSRDGGIIHNVRFELQILALKQLFKFPFGGRQMDLAHSTTYIHNVWLDMANTSGLIPFVLIAAYTIITFYDLIKLIQERTVSQETKYLLVSAYFSFFLYYMVEPALDANLIYWSVWMLIGGLIKGLLQNRRHILNME